MFNITSVNGFQLTQKERCILNIASVVLCCLMIAAMIAFPFATTDKKYGQDIISSVANNMVNIIGLVFRSVGVILAVYAVGQLVLAFKNEDADSKSRASTMLVVGIVLIALPTIISTLNLVEYINNFSAG